MISHSQRLSSWHSKLNLRSSNHWQVVAYTCDSPPSGSEVNTESIQVASQPRPHPHQLCGNCGSSSHKSRAQNCPERGQACRNCGKLNHFFRVCCSPPAEQPREHVQLLTTIIHNVTSKQVNLKTCTVIVEDVTLPLLVDMGATASPLNLETYNKFFAHHPLSAPSIPLLGYRNATSPSLCVRRCQRSCSASRRTVSLSPSMHHHGSPT